MLFINIYAGLTLLIGLLALNAPALIKWCDQKLNEYSPTKEK